jgi:hypothetical protein
MKWIAGCIGGAIILFGCVIAAIVGLLAGVYEGVKK